MSWVMRMLQNLRSAHAAEVGDFRAFGWKRFIVVGAGRFGIERQIELILPAELEARLGDGVVPGLRAGMALGEIGGVGGDLVGDHARL